MNSLKKDYRKLYQQQDKFLSWWRTLQLPFYLTGGTALGRFYLNHRFSEDLDFFVNSDPNFNQYISLIKTEIVKAFDVNLNDSLFTDDFARVFTQSEQSSLKIEFVNDVAYRAGNPSEFYFGMVDDPLNILANKITAIIGRDEPKDIFDIIYISSNYSFKWNEVFYHAKQKAVINEIDVEERLVTFPMESLLSVDWLAAPFDATLLKAKLKRIADDFLLGSQNTLGLGKMDIADAKPH
jgi:predicted nucleotidyltransferase component of viral defense system